MTDYRFIEPLDVLYLRGNRLFGGGGEYSEAKMPPWPSVVAGAIRARLLADSGIDFNRFAAGDTAGLSPTLADSLGTPATPGSFRIHSFSLARLLQQDVAEWLLPAPADIQVLPGGAGRRFHYFHPRILPDVLKSSFPLSRLPVATTGQQAKKISGYWLNSTGIQTWLDGRPLDTEAHTVNSQDLWKTDHRLGIALNADKRTAADNRIYTSDTVALNADIGFLVGIDGAEGLIPDSGLLRLGGDGRGSVIRAVKPVQLLPDWQRIASERRFRLLLTTPGLFPDGWRLPGIDDEGYWRGIGFKARLVSASVARAETVSGWDLARQRPKPAHRVAPAGSLYWFDCFEGDITALQNLIEEGLWPLIENPDRSRLAEGFNRILLAPWAIQND